ncbi:MAG: hypothetical protein ABH871_10260 [Pseudomonadota bacterium]
MMGPTQINAIIPTVSLAQIAAFQAGFLANPTPCAFAGDSFVTPNNAFRDMTSGLHVTGTVRLLADRKKPAKTECLQGPYSLPWLKFMSAAALLTCVGCASTGFELSKIGYTTYPKTNISTPVGVVFKAGKPLPHYEDGNIFSGISAADTKVGRFTIKAGSEIYLNERGNIVGAKPSQDIKIPISPILEKIHGSIFRGFILSYNLDVLREGFRGKITVKELIEILENQGGMITIPAHGIRVFFDEDGEIDKAEFLIEELLINDQLKILVKATTIDLADKLAPFFPKS